MYCSNCGAGLPDDSRFCADCGAPVANLSDTLKASASADSAHFHEETHTAPESVQAAPAEATSVQDAAQTEPPKSVYESVLSEGLSQTITGAPQTPDSASSPAAYLQQSVIAPVPEIPVSAAAQAAPVLPVSAAAQAAPVQAVPAKKTKNLLLIALTAAVLVILGAAAFFVIRNFLPSAGGSRFTYSVTPLIVNGEDEMLVYSGASKPVTIKGYMSQMTSSADGKKFAVISDVDDEGNGTLYFFDGTKAKKLADSAYSFEISSNGNTVAYITDYDYENSCGTLNIYDVSKGKSEEVADEANSSIILSPDGKSYAYISDLKTDDSGTLDSYTSYISINGKEAEPLDSNMQVVALSNSADYIYYLEWMMGTDEDGKLYVRHGKTDAKIGTADANDNFVFNQDLSEVMYSNNGKTYFSKAGGDKEKTADLPLSYMIVPRDTQLSYSYNYLLAITYNVRSLTDQLYLFDDSTDMSISYLDGKKNLTDLDTIGSDSMTFQMDLCANGRSLYYTDDSGKIRIFKNALDLKSKSQKIDTGEEVIWFAVYPDQSAIYYTDSNGTLWAKHGTGDPIDVADDVIQNSVKISPDGKGVYFISDLSVDDETSVSSGTLCYLSNAKKAKPVEIADDVSSVEVSDFGIVYYVFDQMSDDGYKQLGEAFYSKDGKKFESVMDNAVFW